MLSKGQLWDKLFFQLSILSCFVMVYLVSGYFQKPFFSEKRLNSYNHLIFKNHVCQINSDLQHHFIARMQQFNLHRRSQFNAPLKLG